MKIKSIYIKNIRVIDEFKYDFNGCSAIVYGPNGIGKTTFLRYLFDRLNGVKGSLRSSNSEGKYKIEFDDGSYIEYLAEPTKNGNIKEKMIYVSKDNDISNVTREIINKIWPSNFDINRFIEMHPKDQMFYLAKQLNVDIKPIIETINDLKEERQVQRRLLKQKENTIKELQTQLKVFDITMKDILKAKEEKEQLLLAYTEECKKIEKEKLELEKQYNDLLYAIKEFELAETTRINELEKKKDQLLKWLEAKPVQLDILFKDQKGTITPDELFNRIDNEINKHKTRLASNEKKSMLDKIGQQLKSLTVPAEPDVSHYDQILSYEEKIKLNDNIISQITTLKNEIDDLNRQIDKINNDIEAYERELHDTFNSLGIEKLVFTSEGVFYNDNTGNMRELKRFNLSTSELYEVGVMIGMRCCGELKTLIFDISSFDKETFKRVFEKVNELGYQVLVERPSWDNDNMLKVELIEEL